MSESYRMSAAGAAPPRKVFIAEEPPRRPLGSGPSQGSRVDPERGSRVDPERGSRVDPERGSRAGGRSPGVSRRGLGALGAALALSCLLWAALHGLGLKKQWEMRAELELLLENNSENWAHAWQELLRVRLHQLELLRITALLCQTIEDSRKCPPGWQFYDNSCYFFSSLERGWAPARNFCDAFDAHLVVVSTEEEQMFLMRNIQGNNTYWMGVTDEQHEGKWTWVTGKSPTFGFWDVWAEDPDREHKDCGAMKPNGRWINERCSERRRWICEKPWNCNFLPQFLDHEEPAPEM